MEAVVGTAGVLEAEPRGCLLLVCLGHHLRCLRYFPLLMGVSSRLLFNPPPLPWVTS